jgi:hypothetical protein
MAAGRVDAEVEDTVVKYNGLVVSNISSLVIHDCRAALLELVRVRRSRYRVENYHHWIQGHEHRFR